MSLTKRQLRLWMLLRRVIALGAGTYAVALLIFMVLRLLFGDSLWWLAFLGNFTPFYFAALIVLLPLALLALLARSKRGALLLLPFALVGLAWYAPLYLPKAQAMPADDVPTVRVVTFNVWGDNPDLTHVEGWLREQRADVAVTVELPPAWENGVPALLDIYPEQHTQVAQGKYWGSTTLTRYEVISAERFDLAEIPQQRLVLDVGGRQIAVYNIHLYVPVGQRMHLQLPENYYTSSFARYDDTARDAQIQTLIERLEGETLPYIVAGDFNMSDQSAAYKNLAAAMTDSFREAGRGLGTSWPMLKAVLGLPTFIPALVRIDYIWHSEHFRTLEAAQGPYLGSDHLPLSAALALD